MGRRGRIIMRIIGFFCLLLLAQLSFGQQRESLALEYFRKGEFVKAKYEFNELYKQNPSNKYYEYLLKCHLNTQELKDAEKLVKTQLKQVSTPFLLNIDLAKVYQLQGKEKKAKTLRDEIVKNLPPYTEIILKVGKKFFQNKNYFYAEKVYKKGRKLVYGDYPFSFEMAEVHAAVGNWEKMVAEILYVLSFGQEYMEGVKNAINTHLYDDQNGKKHKLFRTQLLKIVQKSPDEKQYLELLIWMDIESQNYSSAFIFAKSLDKRLKESGGRLMNLASIARKNYDFEVATQCYDYVLANKEGTYNHQIARMNLVKVLKEKMEQSPVKSQQDINSLEKAYRITLKEVGKNSRSVELMRGHAKVLAFDQNRPQEAIQILQEAIAIPRLKPVEKAKCKIMLGDIYVYVDDVWEAALMFGQVNQDFKDDPVGFKAKLKAAKAYYYTGNFDWAKTQLDVLKAATTKLIANDALQLSVLISDNLGMDTNTVALHLYAKADLHFYQGNLDSALFSLYQLVGTFPDHLSLLDEAHFLQAKIYTQTGEWEKTIEAYEKVVDYNDLLVDDALLQLGIIQETILNSPEKALQYYEKILLDFPDSVLAVEARKRYRKLKKSTLN